MTIRAMIMAIFVRIVSRWPPLNRQGSFVYRVFLDLHEDVYGESVKGHPIVLFKPLDWSSPHRLLHFFSFFFLWSILDICLGDWRFLGSLECSECFFLIYKLLRSIKELLKSFSGSSRQIRHEGPIFSYALVNGAMDELPTLAFSG
jgi:hypothetical protein